MKLRNLKNSLKIFKNQFEPEEEEEEELGYGKLLNELTSSTEEMDTKGDPAPDVESKGRTEKHDR